MQLSEGICWGASLIPCYLWHFGLSSEFGCLITDEESGSLLVTAVLYGFTNTSCKVNILLEHVWIALEVIVSCSLEKNK